MPPKYHESVPKAVEDLPRSGPPLSLRLGELRFLARNMILGISSPLKLSCQPPPNTQ
jgi:hypothetical protein